MKEHRIKILMGAGLMVLMAGTAWAKSTQSDPVPFTQSDQPVKNLHRLVVCIQGGFETKGKTAEQCKAMGGRFEEIPELTDHA